MVIKLYILFTNIHWASCKVFQKSFSTITQLIYTLYMIPTVGMISTQS